MNLILVILGKMFLFEHSVRTHIEYNINVRVYCFNLFNYQHMNLSTKQCFPNL